MSIPSHREENLYLTCIKEEAQRPVLRWITSHTGDKHADLSALQKTYFRQGFFNVTADFDRYVRNSDGPVRLQLGRNGPEIEATVKRGANQNATARIYGRVALRNWFQKNFKPLQTVNVDLSSQDVIVLDRNQMVAVALAKDVSNGRN